MQTEIGKNMTAKKIPPENTILDDNTDEHAVSEYVRKFNGKVTSDERKRRINKVAKWLVNGMSRQDILQKSSELWDIKDSAADKYIHQARKLMKEAYDVERTYYAAELLSKYENIFALALENKQLSNAIAAVNGQARLTRIDPSTQNK